MKLISLPFILFLLFPLCIQAQKNCTKIPSQYQSYSEAISTVRSYQFEFHDEVITSKSSWIRSAEYYSCNRKFGYLIISTDSSEYIHKDVPLHVWNKFKTADSFGRFYNTNLKGKYQFKI